MEKHKCKQCSHEWIGRLENGKPAECPKCKSYYWNQYKEKSINDKSSN